VADTRLLPRAERIALLEALRAAYTGAGADVEAVARAAWAASARPWPASSACPRATAARSVTSWLR
jgi:hypothetical protein